MWLDEPGLLIPPYINYHFSVGPVVHAVIPRGRFAHDTDVGLPVKKNSRFGVFFLKLSTFQVLSCCTLAGLVLAVICAGCTATGLKAVTDNESSGAPAETPVSATPAISPGNTSAVPVAAKPTPAPTSAPAKTVYATYSNPTYGLTISYPEDWQVQEPDQLALRDYGRMTLNIANFVTPSNKPIAIMSVDVDPASTTDLEKYFNTAILSHQSYYEHWELTKHNPQLKISDNFAYRSDYRISDDNGWVKTCGIQLYTIVKGRPYIFTFKGSEAAYNEYLVDFQDLIRFIRITPVVETPLYR